MDLMKQKAVINRAAHPLVQAIKDKVILEQGKFPCCGLLNGKHTDELFELVFTNKEVAKAISKEGGLSGQIYSSRDGKRSIVL